MKKDEISLISEEDIKVYLTKNGIDFIYKNGEFLISGKFNIRIVRLDIGTDTSDAWEIKIEGVDVGNYFHSIEIPITELLEDILAIYNGNYEIVAKGILRKKKHLVVNTKSYGSYSLGKVIN